MSIHNDYYARDRFPTRAQSEHGHVYGPRKPIIRRVGPGRRARVTVETGAEESKYHQEQELNAAIRRERRAAEAQEIRMIRRNQLHRPTARYDTTAPRRRRNSTPVKTSFSSPAPRPSVPSSEVRPLDDISPESPPAEMIDEDNVEEYDFNLPKLTPTVKFADDVAFIIPESGSNDSSDQTPQPTKSKFTGAMTELSISRSQWSGNTFERGELGAEIATIARKGEQSEKQHISMMKWYHLERHMMNFEEFMAASLSVMQMPEKEQRNVAKLLRDVQKKFEKQRHHGREMDPDCVSDFFYNESTDDIRQTASVMFL